MSASAAMEIEKAARTRRSELFYWHPKRGAMQVSVSGGVVRVSLRLLSQLKNVADPFPEARDEMEYPLNVSVEEFHQLLTDKGWLFDRSEHRWIG